MTPLALQFALHGSVTLMAEVSRHVVLVTP